MLAARDLNAIVNNEKVAVKNDLPPKRVRLPVPIQVATDEAHHQTAAAQLSHAAPVVSR